MIPRIKYTEPYYRNYGYKYMVVGKHGIDMTHDLLTAIRYWFWHCGINSKIAFWKWKRD